MALQRRRTRTAHSTIHSYKMVYRFEEHNVITMPNIFLGLRDERRSHSLTRKEKLECFLRYVGDPGYQINVGEQISVHQGTVSRNVHEVAQKIVSKCKDYIRFPTTAAEVNTAKETWANRFTHPHAIGVIDGTLIPIQKPCTCSITS